MSTLAHRVLAPSLLSLLVTTVGSVSAQTISECPSIVVEGVDVSATNGTINWSSVQGSGRGFAFAFATQGNYHTDSQFTTNWPAIKAAGMYRSATHFFDPTIDGVTQANYFLSAVNAAGGFGKEDLPATLDLECPTSSVQASANPNCEYTGDSGWVTTSVLTQRVSDWLNTVQAAMGKKPLIYSYPSWFNDVSFTVLSLARNSLYISTYAACASVPTPWAAATFWQYSLSGTVPGISGSSTDLDRFVGSAAQLQVLADRIFADGFESLPQTIQFTSTKPSGAVVAGPTYNVTATASSGLPVTLTIDASATSVCSLSTSTVSFTGAGTCVIDANQAGDANYSPAPQASQSFAVGKGTQTITFTSTAPTYGSATAAATPHTYNVTTTVNSGLTVTFTTSGACSNVGGTVTFGPGAGTCTINANQAGDSNWNAAPQVQQSTTVEIPASATNDIHNITGNVAIAANTSVTSNDTGTNTAIKSYGASTGSEDASIGTATVTAQGGSVTLVAAGTYNYDPPANFTGTDTFKYIIGNDLAATSTGTVTLTVSDRIIVVSVAGGGNCKPVTPTPCTLATADALAAPTGTDLVFVESGSYGSASFALNANQKLAGNAISLAQAITDAGITLATDSVALATIAANTTPTLSNSNNVITLGGGNLVEYFSIANSAGSAILGTSVSGATVHDISISTNNGNGINITGINSGTLAFGNLAVTAATGNAFALASGSAHGGTLTVTGTANTLSSSGGTALNVTNADIGASGITFRSVSATGGTTGIVMNNTIGIVDSGGGLTVTGNDASSPSDTTRGNSTMGISGGAIAVGDGGSIDGTVGPGIALNSTNNVILRSVQIGSPASGSQTVNSGNNGITASNVSGLALDNVLITGFVGNSGLRGTNVANLSMQHVDIEGNGTAVGTESSHNWNFRLDNLAGNCGVAGGCGWSNSLFRNSRENVVGVTQSNAGINTALTITNCQFSDTTLGAPGNDAFVISGSGNAVTNVTVVGSLFQNVEGAGFQFTDNDNASGSVAVRNNDFEGTGSDVNLGHNYGNPTAGAALTFDISGNAERQTAGNSDSATALAVSTGGSSYPGTQMTGKIENNVIGNTLVTGSGSSTRDGIDAVASGAGTIIATITGNTVHQTPNGEAFLAQAISGSYGSSTLDLAVHNNVFVVDGTGSGLDGLSVTASVNTGDASVACLDVQNTGVANTLTGDPAYADFTLQALADGGVALVGYTGATNDTAAITAFVEANNTTPNSTTPIVTPAGTATIRGVTDCGVTFP